MREPLYVSESTVAQRETEVECEPYFANLTDLPPDQIDHLRQTGLLPSSGLAIQLLRDKHVEYLSQVWKRSLGAPFVSLDASRPWILYWCLHGCDLLEEMPTDHDRCRMVLTLEHCWTSFAVTEHPVSSEEDPLYYSSDTSSYVEGQSLIAGGFGGGPSQIPHAATSYASVLSLCILLTSGGEASNRARTLIQKIRIPMYRWMLGLLQAETGAYRMHTDGEVDIRASYTILCCATLLGLASPALCQDSVVQYIQRCQTFEGGLGGEPWTEAHGGYAYCGVAALQILGKLHMLDVPALTGWLARRQMEFEGGFSGRCNKLVDGCYSFWQGATMAITSTLHESDDRSILVDTGMLERYILLCAQDIHGGLRDKPSKSRDFYHSCYNLSGLSIGQGDGGRVAKTHPCFNIRIERAQEILAMKW